jgi:thioredoxin-like negative regulator of GroEL
VSHRRLIVPLLLVSLSCAFAQFQSGNLKVRVVFSDGHPCNLKVRVRLMVSAGNTVVAESYTDDSGLTDFDDVQVGNYHLVISGEGIQETDSGLFAVDSRRGTQFQTVTVKRVEEVNQPKAQVGSTVAVADINIPRNAAKQFNKASELIAKEDWNKAIDQLKRTIELYPNYAEAYNNLGVVYGRLGDRSAERAALEKAVAINDHFVPAWLNLGRMEILERDFPKAEEFLVKATVLAPSDTEILTILANVELVNLHYDDAIAHCRKVHAMGPDSHALVHFISARALEHENRIPDAADELHTFLKEEPTGLRADAARRELATLQGQAR